VGAVTYLFPAGYIMKRVIICGYKFEPCFSFGAYGGRGGFCSPLLSKGKIARLSIFWRLPSLSMYSGAYQPYVSTGLRFFCEKRSKPRPFRCWRCLYSPNHRGILGGVGAWGVISFANAASFAVWLLCFSVLPLFYRRRRAWLFWLRRV